MVVCPRYLAAYLDTVPSTLTRMHKMHRVLRTDGGIRPDDAKRIVAAHEAKRDWKKEGK
jgi:hypothetical protein